MPLGCIDLQTIDLFTNACSNFLWPKRSLLI